MNGATENAGLENAAPDCRSVESTSNRSAVAVTSMPNADIDIETQPSTDWSDIAAAPSPVVLRNRGPIFKKS